MQKKVVSICVSFFVADKKKKIKKEKRKGKVRREGKMDKKGKEGNMEEA